MARRKIHETAETGGFMAKVYRDAENDEYRVALWHNGRKVENADYFTNDKADALDTAAAMVADAIKAEVSAVEIDGIEYDRETREIRDIRVRPSVFPGGDSGAIVRVSAEDGLGFADYYGEYRGGYPWIAPALESFATARGLIWEWINPGAIGLYRA